MNLDDRIRDIASALITTPTREWDTEELGTPLTPCIIKAMIQEVMRTVINTSYVWALCNYVLHEHHLPAVGEPMDNPHCGSWTYMGDVLPEGGLVNLLLTRYVSGPECRATFGEVLKRYASVSQILRGSLRQAYLSKLIATYRF